MNLILLLVIGFLVFIGTYMILSINLIRIVIGISIYTHAGNLIIMSMGTYGSSRSEPLITGGNQLFVDPLLQAIVILNCNSYRVWYDCVFTCTCL